MLSDNYNGKNIKNTYYINILSGRQEANFIYNIDISKQQLLTVIRTKSYQNLDIECIKELLSFIFKKIEINYLTRSVDKAFNEMQIKSPDFNGLTKQNFDDFWIVFWKYLKPVINNKIKK